MRPGRAGVAGNHLGASFPYIHHFIFEWMVMGIKLPWYLVSFGYMEKVI